MDVSKGLYVCSKRIDVFYTLMALHKEMKFSIKDLFSKRDQIRRKLRIWSHLLKKSLTENFIFCAGWINQLGH